MMMELYKNLKQKLNTQDRIGEINNMSEYNENNINGELEEILDNAFNKYIRQEEEYKELAVQVFEKSLEDNPETEQLLNVFKSLGATDLEAKIKLAEFMLAGL